MKLRFSLYRTVVFWLLVMMVSLNGGCTLGPRTVTSDWREYNDTVVNVANRELLLNIVRLRYNDYPGVLRIGSVTSQRTWTMNGSLGGALTEGGPDGLNLGIGALRAERPTVSFLPSSKESVNASLSPLSLESLYLASYLEWPASTFWPLMVKSINGVQNAPEGGGPLSTQPPEYAEFFQVTQNLKQLQDDNLVEIGRIQKLEPISEGIDASTLTAAESRAAAESGYEYKNSSIQGELTLVKKDQISVLRFSPQAVGTPQYQLIVDVLDLDPSVLEFELEPAFESSLTQSNQKRKKLDVGLRSLLEMLFLVSKGVEVPQCDLVNNFAPSSDVGVDWHSLIGGFTVLNCDEEPACAAIAVCYRGTWFYIADSDQKSKTTFFFIKLIYDAQIQGGGAENLPVLTLPL